MKPLINTTHPQIWPTSVTSRPRIDLHGHPSIAGRFSVALGAPSSQVVASNNGLKWAICSVRSEGRSVGCSGRPLDAFSSRRKRPAWSLARGAGRA
jgi:hypothetical protein